MLLLLFILVPIVEWKLLVAVDARLGLGATLGLIVFTGILGASLARRQGLAVFAGLQAELAAGRSPARQLVEGVLVFAAGLVLLTPGFLTDVVGFLLLVPPVRALLAQRLQARFASGAGSGRMRVHVFGGPGAGGDGARGPFDAAGGPGAGPQPRPGPGPVPAPGGRRPEIVDAEVVEVREPDES